jgi:hypothetical protein
LEAHDHGDHVLRQIGIERLRDRAQGAARPNGVGYLDLLIADVGSTGRKLLPATIESLGMVARALASPGAWSRPLYG